jgi:hypothetical protein
MPEVHQRKTVKLLHASGFLEVPTIPAADDF